MVSQEGKTCLAPTQMVFGLLVFMIVHYFATTITQTCEQVFYHEFAIMIVRSRFTSCLRKQTNNRLNTVFLGFLDQLL
ncbi:MAG: hypothetical protein ABI970_11795, partial [Chloroflexota bacterium]